MDLTSTLKNPLSSDELQQLNKALTDRGGLSVFETHGLLCAILSGPRQVPSRLWLTSILGHKKEFNSLEEAKTLTHTIMRLNNQIADELWKNDLVMPLIDTQPMATLSSTHLDKAQKQNLSLWCRGYLAGVALDSKGWYASEHEELGMLLFPILILAQHPKLDYAAIKLQLQKELSIHETEAFLTSGIDVLPVIIPAIYDFWQDQSLLRTGPLRHTKIGRNEPCPCGSGKKFKKCCLDDVTLH